MEEQLRREATVDCTCGEQSKPVVIKIKLRTELLENWSSIYGGGGDSSVRHTIQISYGTHSASRPVVPRGFFPSN
jgi:hypothetical protein